ncbi:MAG: hypothetical protein J6J93_03180 [Muribaculaceae bacterium]|nr:hypothetical protein [Muribaculaceae bacterium]
MEHRSDNILDNPSLKNLGSPAGYKVPEGYFESFAENMEKLLPERPELEQVSLPATDRTFWQKVRPYVYMAAMFAGIWMMLQMFAMLGSKTTLEPMESNPMIANALSTEDFVTDYVYRDMSSRELVDDMLDEGEIDENYEFTGLSMDADAEADSDSTYILP